MHTLPRKRMIKRKSLLTKLFQTGRKVHAPNLRLLYLVVPSTELLPSTLQDADFKHWQVAMGAGKKYFKRAVDRNRLKRLMREGFRLNQHELDTLTSVLKDQHKVLLIFFQFTGKALVDYSTVVQELMLSLCKLRGEVQKALEKKEL